MEVVGVWRTQEVGEDWDSVGFWNRDVSRGILNWAREEYYVVNAQGALRRHGSDWAKRSFTDGELDLFPFFQYGNTMCRWRDDVLFWLREGHSVVYVLRLNPSEELGFLENRPVVLPTKQGAVSVQRLNDHQLLVRDLHWAYQIWNLSDCFAAEGKEGFSFAEGSTPITFEVPPSSTLVLRPRSCGCRDGCCDVWAYEVEFALVHPNSNPCLILYRMHRGALDPRCEFEDCATAVLGGSKEGEPIYWTRVGRWRFPCGFEHQTRLDRNAQFLDSSTFAIVLQKNTAGRAQNHLFVVDLPEAPAGCGPWTSWTTFRSFPFEHEHLRLGLVGWVWRTVRSAENDREYVVEAWDKWGTVVLRSPPFPRPPSSPLPPDSFGQQNAFEFLKVFRGVAFRQGKLFRLVECCPVQDRLIHAACDALVDTWSKEKNTSLSEAVRRANLPSDLVDVLQTRRVQRALLRRE